MAYINITRTAGFNLTERFNTLRAEIATRVARRAAFRQTFNELSAMTDRELADIGVARCAIAGIAREASNRI